MDNKKLMIIDGSSLLHRAFYALPLLSTKDGIYTNGVYGFLTMLYRIRDEYNPEYICVAFDKKGPTFRHKEYEEYKGTRQSTPTELAQQFPIIRQVLKAMNIVTLEMSEYEADDIAGTLARIGEENGMETILVTGDKDYFQLARDNVKVLLTRKGITELEIFDRDKIVIEYGIEPKQLIDLKGLMGDNSDNIPGVPGVLPGPAWRRAFVLQDHPRRHRCTGVRDHGLVRRGRGVCADQLQRDPAPERRTGHPDEHHRHDCPAGVPGHRLLATAHAPQADCRGQGSTPEDVAVPVADLPGDRVHRGRPGNHGLHA